MLDANIKSITGFILSLCDGNTDKKLKRALDGDAYNPIEEGVAEKFVGERQLENIEGSKKIVFWFNPPMKKTNSAALALGFEDDVLVGARADIGSPWGRRGRRGRAKGPFCHLPRPHIGGERRAGDYVQRGCQIETEADTLDQGRSGDLSRRRRDRRAGRKR